MDKLIWRKHKNTGFNYNIQTSLIIKCPKDKLVIGRIENKKFIPVDKKTIELCQKYNLLFDIEKVNISFNWYDKNRDEKDQQKYDTIVENIILQATENKLYELLEHFLCHDKMLDISNAEEIFYKCFKIALSYDDCKLIKLLWNIDYCDLDYYRKDLYDFFIETIKNNKSEFIVNELKTSCEFREIFITLFSNLNIFDILEQITGLKFIEELKEISSEGESEYDCELYSDIDTSLGFKD
jgi:hypothetical protein